MTLHETLARHAFIAGLHAPQIVKLASLAHKVTFQENEAILRAGERSKYFYLLLSGSVCVEVTARAYSVRIQSLGPGDAFGWSALLDRHDTLFQVRAREESAALCLDGAGLAAAFREDPVLAAELLRRVLKVAADRVQATESTLGELCGIRPSRGSELLETRHRPPGAKNVTME
jgi:CRP-like cAMP-binding protein